MADRRKEQNKRAQQRFREKRQKELEELKNSFTALKGEMSNLQTALDVAQKENRSLRSRLDNPAPPNDQQDWAVLTDDHTKSFLDYTGSGDDTNHSWLDVAVFTDESNIPEKETTGDAADVLFSDDGAITNASCGASQVAGADALRMNDFQHNNDRDSVAEDSLCNSFVHDAPESAVVNGRQALENDAVGENGSKIQDLTPTLDNQSFLPTTMSGGYDSNPTPPMLDMPPSIYPTKAHYNCQNFAPLPKIPEMEWSMIASNDSGTRLMCLFSQLLNLEYTRLASLNQTPRFF